MLVFAKIAAGAESAAGALAAHLLEKTLPDDYQRASEYYLRTAGLDPALLDAMGSTPRVRADLDPILAKALALTPGSVIDEAALKAILSGAKANGKPVTDRKRKLMAETKDGTRRRISGMDLCFAAPKSVSVMWAFAENEAVRASILQAHRDATNEALRCVEEQVGTRVGANGGQVKAAGKFAWISIEHFTARPTVAITRPDPKTGVVGTELYTVSPSLRGDPHLHSHNIVPNYTVAEDGRIVAINTKQLHNRIKEFGSVYQALLARNLRAIGIEMELDARTRMAKASAIPDSVCEEFSKRTKDAQAAARAEAASRGLDWDAMPDQDRIDFLKGGAKASRKSKTDDLACFEAWFAQAKAMGWRHEASITTDPHAPHNIAAARDTALPFLAEEFSRRAVITGSDARLQAVRGLIAKGMRTTADISAVTRLMVQEGIIQDDRLTQLLYAETEKGVRITTVLHRDQEEELIELARDAAADRSRSLSTEELNAAIRRTGIKFTGDHGAAQRKGVEALGLGGELGVLVGTAGSGKTTLLKSLVDAWHQQGLTVLGTSLGWKQANALADAGIPLLKTFALQPLIDGITDGFTTVGRDSVIVIDELGQIGTRQLLQLLRLQKRFGFKIVAVGDDRQCTAIEAGPVIDLLRKALGADTIPEILTTIRQKSEREREIAGMFREGRIAEALTMKRTDGTAELVEGTRTDAIERITDLAIEQGGDLTLSAPTNADAQDISKAIRKRRQAAGTVGPDRRLIRATNGRGHEFEFHISEGDKVRLFKRTRAKFGRIEAQIGNNGSVLTVVEVRDDGLLLRGESGKEGFVAWSKLDHNGRSMLALGECLTIESAQGLTSDRHIFCAPSGSSAVDGFRAYVSSSRHRISSWMILSRGEEMKETADRLPLGLRQPITEDVIWNNVVRNLSRRPVKDSAIDFLAEAAVMNAGVTKGFQAQMRRKAAGDQTDMKRKAGIKQWSMQRVRGAVRRVFAMGAHP
ncbi:MobF family relaxase [Rhodopila sp.]|uniref:MobF family relaxase n=1 Tax=Rhodopila sp. TaxID=2480087 RepID=UPI003D0D6927